MTAYLAEEERRKPKRGARMVEGTREKISGDPLLSDAIDFG